MAAAIGAAIAVPGKPVVAILGDAAFAMAGLEIHTAVELGLPVVWVVLNNGGNAMVAHVQRLSGLSVAGAYYGRRFDTAAVARALGADAVTVTTWSELDRALAVVAVVDRPLLIDVYVDPNEAPWSLGARVQALARRSGYRLPDCMSEDSGGEFLVYLRRQCMAHTGDEP